MKHKRKKKTPKQSSGGVTGSIFAGYIPLASRNPYPIQLLKSLLWPIIDLILVNFGQMKFSRSKLSHFSLCTFNSPKSVNPFSKIYLCLPKDNLQADIPPDGSCRTTEIS